MSLSYKNIKPAEWLLISVANEAGYDKLSWEERIVKGKELVKAYLDGNYEPSNALEFKRLNEVEKMLNDELDYNPTVYLDATASGLQVLSAVSLDLDAGRKVNIGSDYRADVYTEVSKDFSNQFGLEEISRDDVKKPIMTYFYNSNAKIKELLGDDLAELFFEYLSDNFTGPVKVMKVLRDLWTENKYHYWKLPDMGAYVPVEKAIIGELEIKGCKLPYTYYVNQGDLDQWRSLAPNIVHSLDAYILRYVVRKFKKANKPISVIHDSFQVSIMDATYLIDAYKEAFIDIVEKEIFMGILNDLGLANNGYNDKLAKEIMINTIKESEYMLS